MTPTCEQVKSKLIAADPNRADRILLVHQLAGSRVFGRERICADCGQPAKFWILEGQDTPWFYCGECEIGG